MRRADTAIVVVHGVGDPIAGDALDHFVQGLAGSQRWVEVQARRQHHRPEPGGAAAADGFVSTYPEHTATMAADADLADVAAARVELREVYWGDLSRVKGSLIALVFALFDLVFGMRHMVRAARQEVEAAAADLGAPAARRCLCTAGSCAGVALWLTRGPLFALNILAATVALLFIAIQRVLAPAEPVLLGGDVPVPTWAPSVAMVIGGAAVFAAGWFLRGHLVRRGWSRSTVHAMIGFGALFVGWTLLVERPESMETIIAWVTRLIAALTLVVAVSGIAMLAFNMAGMLATGAVRSAEERRAAIRRGVTVMTFCTTLGLGLFTFVLMVAWTVVRNAASPKLQEHINAGLHLFVLIWFSFVAVVALYLAIFAVNRWLNGRGSPRARLRYIVNPFVVAAFVAISLLYAVIYLPLGLMIQHDQFCVRAGPPSWCASALFHGWLDPFRAWISPVQRQVGFAIAASGALVAVMVASRMHLLTVLDLVLDVIAHFRTDEAARKEERERRLWNRMVARFRDVVARTLAETGAQRLIVVSHSQGTMIALQGLGMVSERDGPRQTPVVPADCAATLVTLGSPVGHIYRHYLPRRYRLEPRSASNVGRWVNVFRIDDFIGTRIEATANGPDQQRVVGARGHTDYWRDLEVLEQIAPLLQATQGGRAN